MTSLISISILIFILNINCMHLKAMQYYEPLDLNDIDSFFGEDNCIEGTLSVTEDGSPILKSISFTESSTSMKYEGKDLVNEIEEKSSMSLLNELVTFNNIKHVYTLINEEGPSHRKKFTISLRLGEEEYMAEGTSIKSAQHEAAKLALNSTSYNHPLEKPKKSKLIDQKKTSVQKLYKWLGEQDDSAVQFYFTQHSKTVPFGLKNYYHKGMYSKVEDMHKVTLKIGNQQFVGEGPTSEVAKEKAASYALTNLQQSEGFCMLDGGEASFFGRLFSYDSENHSPISLVLEFASKSKLPAIFELVSEEGPAHYKRFVYSCNVGDEFETFGEGNNKKSAKREAAKNMIDKLKSYASYNLIGCGNSVRKPKKMKSKKKRNNLVKSVVKSYSEEEYFDSDSIIAENIDPISRLFQIQQQKKDVQPIFSVIQENGNNIKEFVVEASVGDISFVASGPNKKTAKRNAAEGLLRKLGYWSTSENTRLSNSENKRKDFFKNEPSTKKHVVPGLNLNIENVNIDNKHEEQHFSDKTKHSSNSKPKALNPNSHTENKPIETKSKKKPSSLRPKQKLEKLSEQLGLKFQFSDFPRPSNKGFLSLLSITTTPPKICYGIGLTIDVSQDNAALPAIDSLYKSQFNSLSLNLKESTNTLSKEKFYMIDGNLVEPLIFKETE